MPNPLYVAQYYAQTAGHHVTQVADNVKEVVIENKSELTHIGTTAVVVGLVARVAGFKSGYKYAKAHS